ncbi:hypothetical protein GCM10027445_02390 [Amycolatopsis endophytica]
MLQQREHGGWIGPPAPVERGDQGDRHTGDEVVGAVGRGRHGHSLREVVRMLTAAGAGDQGLIGISKIGTVADNE